MVTGDEVAIKVFKPVKKARIKREVKIMNILNDHPNVVKILDVVRDSATKTPAMITEYVHQGDSSDVRKIFANFELEDIKNYIYHALKALNHAHSKGIMHRDVKPHNILVSQVDKSVKVSDWGQVNYELNYFFMFRLSTIILKRNTQQRLELYSTKLQNFFLATLTMIIQ